MEALCLCTLLWASIGAANRVVGELTTRDFHRPVYGELFDVITTEVREMKPHDPACIAASLAEHGKTAGHHGGTTEPGSVGRRDGRRTTGSWGELRAGCGLRRLPTRLLRRRCRDHPSRDRTPQDQLFDHLVAIGRERRTATDRMHRITTVLVPAGVSALPGTLRPAPRKGHPHDEQQ